MGRVGWVAGAIAFIASALAAHVDGRARAVPKAAQLRPLQAVPSVVGNGAHWAATTDELWHAERTAAQLLGPGLPGSGAAALAAALGAQDPLVVSAPPGAADAATEALRTLRAMLFFFILSISLVCAAVATCIAYEYRKHKADPTPSKYQAIDDFAEYKTGIFEFWDDLPLCCFVIQCPWIRWAENISMVTPRQAPQPSKIPILGFWAAFCTVLILTILINPGGALVWLIFAGVLAYFRQVFRKAFGMKSNTGSCLKDCLGYLCCCYCLILQDARHAEEASKHQHPAIVVP